MDIYSYTTQTSEEILKSLDVDPGIGLDKREVRKRLEKFGPNIIQGYRITWWQILFRQFCSPLVYLLIIASALAFLLGEMMDSAMIILFVMINATLGFYQTYRSEKILELLKKYTVIKTRVWREGEGMVVKSEELVPGDIVDLKIGDKIPADLRLIEVYNFSVDESALTGESNPVSKISKTLSHKAKELYEAENLGFAGTIAASGRAKGVVVATGRKTMIGEIGRLATETAHIGGFDKEIMRLAQFIVRLVFATLISVILLHLLFKGVKIAAGDLIVFAIALAVGVIPEALPVVVTLSLARGALRLAKKKVVVKRLSAIEDLGSIDVLCVDKTGTLTENSLTVDETFPQKDRRVIFFANLAGRLAEEYKNTELDPFDAALQKDLSAEEAENLEGFKILANIPFDPERKRLSVLVKNEDKYLLVVRGAAEILMEESNNLTKAERELNLEWISKKGHEGKRVLAVAIKKLSNLKDGKFDHLERLEGNLEFLGAVSFADPIKETAFGAVKKARELGIVIKILTGDSKEVAGTVARKVGLVESVGDVITGAEFEELSGEDQFEAIEKYAVFARTSPKQKYKIIKMISEKHQVGFLGEGINDAPALKVANVSLAVSGAADIAREAADVVLLKKSLAVIIDGIQLGREIFANTNKYIKITLSSNLGNFYSLAIASLIAVFLPMLPLQLLLLNLLSDFPMITIATDTVDKEEIAKPQLFNIKDFIIATTLFGAVSMIFDFSIFGIFFRFSPAILQTNWFIGSVLTELVLIYSLRTKRVFFRTRFPSGTLLFFTILAAVCSVGLTFLQFGREIFRFSPPLFLHLLTLLGITLLYFLTTEFAKLLYYKYFDNNHILRKKVSA